jgi:hypothetical protein
MPQTVPHCALNEIQLGLYEDRNFLIGNQAAVFSIDMYFLHYHIGTRGNLKTGSK